jgi:hypothetical protein
VIFLRGIANAADVQSAANVTPGRVAQCCMSLLFVLASDGVEFSLAEDAVCSDLCSPLSSSRSFWALLTRSRDGVSDAHLFVCVGRCECVPFYVCV